MPKQGKVDYESDKSGKDKDSKSGKSSGKADPNPKANDTVEEDQSMHSAAQSKQKALDEENMKKYQEEIQKKFEIPHEDPPTDPEQMEEYLLKRMKLLEGVSDAMKSFMIEEESRRVHLNSELIDMQAKIMAVQEREKLNINTKVKLEIKAQLEDAAHQLILVEKERDSLRTKVQEQNYLIAELDGLVMMYHQEDERNKNEVEIQKQMIEGFKKVIVEYQRQSNLKDGEILQKDEMIKKMRQEVDDMRGVLFKLNDVRIVLNRVMEPYSRDPEEMINQMKGNDLNFKKGPPLPPNFTAGGNASFGGQYMPPGGAGPIIVGPKKVLEMSAGNDDDFWYGDKKDKRLDLPPVPDKVRNEVYQSNDSLRNTGGMRPGGGNTSDPSNQKTVRPTRKAP